MQLVHIVERGERAKMSKRRGDFVTLDELIDDIGVDAARFFMLQRSHDTTLDLDLDLARERSQDNPVYYVQYAHARIAEHPAQGRRRRASTSTRRSGADLASRSRRRCEPAERALVKRLLELPDEVDGRPPSAARRTGSPPTRTTSPRLPRLLPRLPRGGRRGRGGRRSPPGALRGHQAGDRPRPGAAGDQRPGADVAVTRSSRSPMAGPTRSHRRGCQRGSSKSSGNRARVLSPIRSTPPCFPIRRTTTCQSSRLP